MTFASRFRGILDTSGRLCVGIDPHDGLLDAWSLPRSADGVRSFGLRVVEATAGRAGIVKPQVAFFERYGAAGYAALEDVISAARGAGLFVIADVKRGDIGSTMDAYAAAWLTPGSPLEADAMTAVAYQGLGSLGGALDLAARHDKGVIVVTATSNPEAIPTQRAARADGRTVAGALVDDVQALPGTAGLVIGATVELGDYGLEPADFGDVPILAPGFGAQGAHLGDLARVFGPASRQVAVHLSREVLGAGPGGIAASIERVRDELRDLA